MIPGISSVTKLLDNAKKTVAAASTAIQVGHDLKEGKVKDALLNGVQGGLNQVDGLKSTLLKKRLFDGIDYFKDTPEIKIEDK